MSGTVVRTPKQVDGVRVENVVASGTFSLDGGTWDVDNNVWLIGAADSMQGEAVVVIDAAHDAQAIADAVGDRAVAAIICTHGHDDHIDAVDALREATDAPAFIHPDDTMLWDATVATPADGELADKQVFDLVNTPLQIIHTPGHTPGACCVYAPELGVVFTGDTLFHGGPGATGRSFSSYPTILESITKKLFALPDDTLVLTGHGEATTIGAEKAASGGWPPA